MASMNPGIILSGRAPDIMGSMARGAETGQFVNDARHTNAYRNALSEYGPGAFQGDPNAMNALAAYDPQGMLGMRTTMNAERRADSAEGRAAEAHRIRLAEYTSGLDAASAAAERERIVKGLSGAAFFYQRGDEQGYNAWLQQQGLDPAEYPMANFEPIAMGFVPVLEALEGVVERNNPNAGGEASVQSAQFLPDMSGVVMPMKDGNVLVRTAGGEELAGQEAMDFIQRANETYAQQQREIYGARREGTLGADIDMGGEAAASVEAGKIAQQAGLEAYQALGKANVALANYDEAIRAIDSGAKSGIIYNMMPSVTASSASLENAMNRLGLDVIGSVTFGALSEAEMRLAMETAVPRNLAPPELRDWLVRKRDAQVKAIDALNRAATYLSTPGNTLQKWMAERGNIAPGMTETPPPPPPPGAGPGMTTGVGLTSPVTPGGGESDADFLKRLGVE